MSLRLPIIEFSWIELKFAFAMDQYYIIQKKIKMVSLKTTCQTRIVQIYY